MKSKVLHLLNLGFTKFQIYQAQNSNTNTKEETQVEVVQTNITAGENSQEVPVEEGKTYRVVISVAYNA